MYTTETQIRVHYALTDQMGFVYYGHYAQFYEIGRTEAIRQIGFTYKDIEAMGIIIPVVDLHCQFLKPARYDDLLTVKTTLKDLHGGHRMVFHTEIYNQSDQLLNKGSTTLICLQADTMKRCDIPEKLMEKLVPYF